MSPWIDKAKARANVQAEIDRMTQEAATRPIVRTEQLPATLRATAEFLYAQGCGEASAAVDAAIALLERPSPTTWDLRDEDGNEWQIALVDPLNGYGQIRRRA